MPPLDRSPSPDGASPTSVNEPRDDARGNDAPKMRAEGLRAFFGTTEILKGVSLDLARRQVTSVIGPSGCGKSTLVRCLNRMHEVVAGASVRGRVTLDGRDIYARDVDPVLVRRRVGMVFQRPNPFPTMSVRENVLAGLRINGLPIDDPEALVEKCLRNVFLWDEVKDALARLGGTLSTGQQQRLCIARCIALEPEVILMDEPCSALDPVATAKIEELIQELSERFTIAIVTHSMQQAARVSDFTAFIYQGELVELATTDDLFTNPKNRRTEDYITGRFG